MKNLISLFFLFTAITSHAAIIHEELVGKLSDDGRRGLHGQVVFGNGPYYMAHIPMLNMPHDIQIVTKVEITHESGAAVQADFSQKTFTVRPSSAFSLNNFAKGKLNQFRGNIHEGSFELGGRVVEGLEGVNFKIVDRHVIRKLPSKGEQAFYELKDEGNTFHINIIDPDRNIQEVKNVSTNKRLWCVKGPDFFSPCD